MAVTIDGSGEISGLDEINNIPLPTTGFGKVLQVVRATDTTDRTTTSVSFVDANISVTITPQKSTSSIILIHTAVGVLQVSGTRFGDVQITDSSNNAISGAELNQFGFNSTTTVNHVLTQIAYSSPATLSAVTYKVRFRSSGTTFLMPNSTNTAQMYAIEVSA